LAGLIAFFVGNDPGRIDSIFRRSGLYREKWDRADYREATIARALTGKSEYYDWSKPTIHVAPAPSQPAAERLAVIAQHLTDIGNAARFATREKNRLRYCHPLGQWFAFNGKVWQPDQCGIALQRGKEMALSIFREVANEQDDVKREKLAKHALASQKKDRITAAIELAKPDLAILPDELDADPLLLNVANGTIDLRTGTLRPHRREDYITKITNANFDPSAECPVFRAFLNRIFRSKPTIIPYFKRVMGYGATGLNIEQVLFFLWGNGANGKTTSLDAVGFTLGDYAGKADRELLAANDAHPTNIADLQGVRMAMLSETNEGRKLDEGKTKDLVGETRLKARKMKKDFSEFRATHKIFLCSNHKPIVRGTDYGFWRRIRLIPFVETISDDEKDPRLLDKLKAEADGILAWIVEGCLEWQRDGLGLPDDVRDATSGYRAEMDSIGAFLDECCLEGERLQATAADLYAAYTTWCEDSGEHPLSQKRFGMQLAERGMATDRCSYSRRKIWRGIGLLSADGGQK
jgi:putative DNA primase/helicase